MDFDRRTDDRTNSSVLLIGNSGQGKSYLLKLLLTNFRESGKAVLGLDPEGEYRELTENLGGCYLDLMEGRYIINRWSHVPGATVGNRTMMRKLRRHSGKARASLSTSPT